MKCQFGISNVRGGDRRALPYVFTEQGVSQLSGVLHNDLAEEISVQIMRAFVAMRRFITANAGLFQRVDAIEQRQMKTEQNWTLKNITSKMPKSRRFSFRFISTTDT